MIIADTNAWIDFIKQPESATGTAIRRLLEAGQLALVGIVLAEVVRGLRNRGSEVGELLDALPFVEMDRETWRRAGAIARQMDGSGRPIPMGDVYIAALALENNHEILTRDKHFDRIPGLRLYDWRNPDA
jgi:predicted nucleic acid-binding protein